MPAATSLLPVARQADPPHSVMWGFAGSLSALSAFLYSSNSTGEPIRDMIFSECVSWRSLRIGFQHVGDLARQHLAVRLAIDLHHRPQGATAQAVDSLQAELQVHVRLPGLDAREVFDGVEHALGAADVTGRAHAHVDLVAPLGDQAESLIEGGDMHDAGHRHSQPFAHSFQRLTRKPMVFCLHIQEYLDQCARLGPVRVDDLVDALYVHVRCSTPLLYLDRYPVLCLTQGRTVSGSHRIGPIPASPTYSGASTPQTGSAAGPRRSLQWKAALPVEGA